MMAKQMPGPKLGKNLAIGNMLIRETDLSQDALPVSIQVPRADHKPSMADGHSRFRQIQRKAKGVAQFMGLSGGLHQP